MPLAGEVLRGYCICSWAVGEAMVRLSPAGIEHFLGSRMFSICNRHIGSASLGILYLDKIGDSDPVTVRCDDGEEICGNVLIFGFNGTLKPLEDFELEAIKANLELEKNGGECTVVLNNATCRANKALEESMSMIEQTAEERHQSIRL